MSLLLEDLFKRLNSELKHSPSLPSTSPLTTNPPPPPPHQYFH
jgi:hypothetical protein